MLYDKETEVQRGSLWSCTNRLHKKGCEICWVSFPSLVLTPQCNGGQGRPIKPEISAAATWQSVVLFTAADRETRGGFWKPNMGTKWSNLPLLLAVTRILQRETHLSGCVTSQQEGDLTLETSWEEVRTPHGLVFIHNISNTGPLFDAQHA